MNYSRRYVYDEVSADHWILFIRRMRTKTSVKSTNCLLINAVAKQGESKRDLPDSRRYAISSYSLDAESTDRVTLIFLIVACFISLLMQSRTKAFVAISNLLCLSPSLPLVLSFPRTQSFCVELLLFDVVLHQYSNDCVPF